MANPSIQLDKHGPDWPLGFVKVASPGTPVSIMSNVDSTLSNQPETAAGPGASASDEFTVRCYRIFIQALKPGASHGTQGNAGNIYIVRRGATPQAGTGNRDDTGSIIATLGINAGTTGTSKTDFTIDAPAGDFDVFSPYRYFIDADNANDGAFVTLFIAH